MTGKEFAIKCQEILKYKTCYAKGTFGQCATPGFIKQKAEQYPEWYNPKNQPSRVPKLLDLPDDTRLFDCCGMVKAIFWNFPNTVYKSNGFPEVNDQGIWDLCKNKSEDFSNIQVGEIVWLKGHVGVYIGDGKAIEATAAWENKVQITAVANIKSIPGLPSRRWIGHGKLPQLTYETTSTPIEKPQTDVSKYPVLKLGSKGDYVKKLKLELLKKGYYPVNDTFDEATLAAVKKYQTENIDTDGKKLVVDGYVGPKTWGSLES